MTFRLAVALALALVALARPAFAGPPQHMTWTVDSVAREALVFAPAALPTTNAVSRPLVFGFHGHGGNMNAAANGMKLQDAWPDAVVVYMQGLPTPAINPNREGLAPGWQWEAGQDGDRDLKFFDAVLATMRQTYPIDDRRIYASGFSQGSFFTLLLWSQRSQVFAAFAACAVAILPPLHLSVPRAYIQTSGQNDQTIPFGKQQAAIEAIKQLDGATAAGQACGTGCTRYPSPGGTPVVTLIHPGGHIYPPGITPRLVGFFKQHVKP